VQIAHQSVEVVQLALYQTQLLGRERKHLVEHALHPAQGGIERSAQFMSQVGTRLGHFAFVQRKAFDQLVEVGAQTLHFLGLAWVLADPHAEVTLGHAPRPFGDLTELPGQRPGQVQADDQRERDNHDDKTVHYQPIDTVAGAGKKVMDVVVGLHQLPQPGLVARYIDQAGQHLGAVLRSHRLQHQVIPDPEIQVHAHGDSNHRADGEQGHSQADPKPQRTFAHGDQRNR